MKKFLSAARDLFSVEYALMACFLAIVTFASLQILGDEPPSNLFRMAFG
jgi:Flp pilus assembly pilin Flp